MNQETPQGPSLFDLLARSWKREAGVRDICPNADGSLLAVAFEDGKVSIVRLADDEPPEARITSTDGQMAIRPRAGRPAPMIGTAIAGATRLSAHGRNDFLVLNAEGKLVRLSGGGDVLGPVEGSDAPVLAFDHSPQAGLTALVSGHHLSLVRGDGGKETVVLPEEQGDPAFVAVSPDGKTVACASAGGIHIVASGDVTARRSISVEAEPACLSFSADGQWLGCGLKRGGFWLIDIATDRAVLVGDFPGSVDTLGWSGPAHAVFASGAYRIAGWSLDTPPFSGGRTGALSAGRPGLVTVGAVATDPSRRLVAAGYAAGQVVVAPIGGAQDLTIRAFGGAVTALKWGGDGRDLMIGDALGTVAVVSFPPQMFK